MDIMQEVAHSLLHKYTGQSAFSYIEYINQQMNLVISSKLQVINCVLWFVIYWILLGAFVG
jgi:hypothetical protein